jgi:hypothetical protein
MILSGELFSCSLKYLSCLHPSIAHIKLTMFIKIMHWCLIHFKLAWLFFLVNHNFYFYWEFNKC